VNEIAFVTGYPAATSQMQEYAGRTMQIGVPRLARDCQPAIIDFAAMPVRIGEMVGQRQSQIPSSGNPVG
jgi:hypothetical protein